MGKGEDDRQGCVEEEARDRRDVNTRSPAASQARALIFGAKRHPRETIRHPCTFTCTTVATNTRNFAALVIDRAFPDSLSFLLPPATKTHIPVFTHPILFNT